MVQLLRRQPGSQAGRQLVRSLALVVNRPLCPDLRGYWGDYDDIEVLEILPGGTTEYVRLFSDSRWDCSYRWHYTSDPLHISSVHFQ